MKSTRGLALTIFAWCVTDGGAIAPKLVDPSVLPLRTDGSQIVDNQGNHVRLNCVNWYGAHMEMMAMNGLNQRLLDDIASGIVELGFNCVRASYSLDLIFNGDSKVPNAEQVLAANPELIHQSALEVFDTCMEALANAGLVVILNNHNSEKMWCCTEEDHNGLWFTETYSEADFFDHVTLIAKRYLHLPLVAGFDLRNELRPSSLGSPNWGDGERKFDWSVAAETAARLVMDVNPDMLVIVSGLVFSTMLCSVSNNALHLKDGLKGHIVYTSHSYSWTSISLVIADILEQGMTGLAIFSAVVVASLAVFWFLDYKGIVQGKCLAALGDKCLLRFLQPGCCSGCCRCVVRSRPMSRPVQAAVGAAVVTVLALSCLLALPRLLLTCSLIGFVLGTLMEVLAGFGLSLVSLWLWARVVLLCIAEHRGLLQLQRREVQEPHDDETPAATKTSANVEVEAGTDGATSMMAAPKDADAVGPTNPSPATNSWVEADPQLTQSDRPKTTLRSVLIRICLSTKALIAALALLMVCLELLVQSYLRRYESTKAEWDFKFGYLVQENQAPVWVGEFGTNSEDLYWKHNLRYLKENDLDWAYWPVNGEKRPGEDESFGLWNPDMKTIRQPRILETLQNLIETRR